MRVGTAKGGIGVHFHLTYKNPNRPALWGKTAIVRLCKPGYRGCVAQFDEGEFSHGWWRFDVADFSGWPDEVNQNLAAQLEVRKIVRSHVVDTPGNLSKPLPIRQLRKLGKAAKRTSQSLKSMQASSEEVEQAIQRFAVSHGIRHEMASKIIHATLEGLNGRRAETAST